MKQQIIAGRNPVWELVSSDSEVEKVLISKNAHGDVIKQIIECCREKNIYVQFVPEVKIQSLSRANHQGIIAFTSLIQYFEVQEIIDFAFAKGENPLLLVLDGITDIRNVGAIARTALGMGVHALVIPKRGSASINDDAIKISSGALLKIPVCRTDNLVSALKDIKINGIELLGLDGSATKFAHECDYSKPIALIAGAEDEGISPAIQKLLDEKIKLPMSTELESYNVSVATAMCLYEVYKSRI